VLIGGGVFTGNTGQTDSANPLLKGVAARMTLWDVHAKYRGRPRRIPRPLRFGQAR